MTTSKRHGSRINLVAVDQANNCVHFWIRRNSRAILVFILESSRISRPMVTFILGLGRTDRPTVVLILGVK